MSLDICSCSDTEGSVKSCSGTGILLKSFSKKIAWLNFINVLAMCVTAVAKPVK